MSFSKAKVKRFNDVIVEEQPLSGQKDRTKATPKATQETNTPASMSTLSKAKRVFQFKQFRTDKDSAKKLKPSRLFRTPSLPRRFKFGESSSSAKKAFHEKVCLTSANFDTICESLATISNNTPDVKKNPVQKIIFEEKPDISKTSEDINFMKCSKSSENVLKNINDVLLKDALPKTDCFCKTHKEELNFVTAHNTELELDNEKLHLENKILRNDKEILSAESEKLEQELSVLQTAIRHLEDEMKNLLSKNEEILIENTCLLNEIRVFKEREEKQLKFMIENDDVRKQIEILQQEKSSLLKVLEQKDNLIEDMRNELIDKDIEMDTQKDNIRDVLNNFIMDVSQKYEKAIFEKIKLNEKRIVELEQQVESVKERLSKEYEEKLKTFQLQKQKDLDLIRTAMETVTKIFEENDFVLDKNCRKADDTNDVKMKSIPEKNEANIELQLQSLTNKFHRIKEAFTNQSKKIMYLEDKLANGIDQYIKINENLGAEIMEIKQEYEKMKMAKYSYELTLNNTRSTVNILMERLKKSDHDVEYLKNELDKVSTNNVRLEQQNNFLESNLKTLQTELEKYKTALTRLRNSSEALERHVIQKESTFDKLTEENITNIRKVFEQKVEQSINKHFHLYTDLKKKYEERECHVREIKNLLEEFVLGIQMAKIELEDKSKKISDLEVENETIKLDNIKLRQVRDQLETTRLDSPKNLKEKERLRGDQTRKALVDVTQNQVNHHPLNSHQYELHSNETQTADKNKSDLVKGMDETPERLKKHILSPNYEMIKNKNGNERKILGSLNFDYDHEYADENTPPPRKGMKILKEVKTPTTRTKSPMSAVIGKENRIAILAESNSPSRMLKPKYMK